MCVWCAYKKKKKTFYICSVSQIFQDGKLSHFIDGRGSSGNWMTYVNCARYAQEQNLIAIQVDREINYEACKDIPQGTELLVWYGDCYLQFMGVPVALKEMADGGAQEEADSKFHFTFLLVIILLTTGTRRNILLTDNIKNTLNYRFPFYYKFYICFLHIFRNKIQLRSKIFGFWFLCLIACKPSWVIHNESHPCRETVALLFNT